MTPFYADDSVTLYHGDCLELADLWTCADVLCTDPPYGMAYDSGWVKGRTRPIANDDTTEARDAVLALWGDRPWLAFGTWRAARPEATSQVLIWDKTDGVGPGMGDLGAAFGTSHEEVYLGGVWPKSAAARRGSVLRTSCAMGGPSGLVASTGHPTPKPLGLMSTLLAAAPLGTVADPFAGSGSTLVAAKVLGRKARRLAQDVLDFGASV